MNMLLRVCLLLFGVLPAASLLADAEREISTALEYYAEVWNEGDFEMIRAYYHPDFMLVTAQGAVPLAERLEDMNALSRSGEDRGDLSYSDTRIQPLGDSHALAYGRVRLAFKDGSAIESWFSTVYVKTPFGWKAILTHQ